jgi:hypothetical protein
MNTPSGSSWPTLEVTTPTLPAGMTVAGSNLAVEEDGVAEVTAFAQRRGLDALLARLGQDLAFRPGARPTWR